MKLFKNTFPDIIIEIWDRSKLFELGIINNQGGLVKKELL